MVIGETLNSGKSIKSIMDSFRVKQDTVLDYLLKYLQEGHTIKYKDELLKLSTLTQDQQHLVLKTFKKLGPWLLKPVFQELDGKISYQELKILRLYHMAANRASDSNNKPK